jgi:CheY-like chemotaxis protein
VVIIEDDDHFARILCRECQAKKLQCLVAADAEGGIALIERHLPAAVLLDIKLAGIKSGWDVLDHVKKTPHLRHIPIHMMSAEEATIDAMKRGAIAFLTKPLSNEELQAAFARIEQMINRQIGRLLVIEDNDVLRHQISALLGGSDVETKEAVSGKEAIAAIQTTRFDCVVLDLGLPDMSGFDLLDRLEALQLDIPPIVIYTGQDLSREDNERLRHYTDSIIIKGVKSVERLLDETALFLHRIVDRLPESKRRMIANRHEQDKMFAGKKLLLVDDDMRNTFALAKILRERHFEVLIASDGSQALELLDANDGIDMVLMDIMMPVMDGLETMRRIRQQERLWNLPIIALTAKAMKGDRAKCIEAGANDYLAKPVDTDRLISILKVWLY